MLSFFQITHTTSHIFNQDTLIHLMRQLICSMDSLKPEILCISAVRKSQQEEKMDKQAEKNNLTMLVT